jgi:hypothetical protein
MLQEASAEPEVPGFCESESGCRKELAEMKWLLDMAYTPHRRKSVSDEG